MSGVEDAGVAWVGPERSVSDRIRELDRAGHSRADIARMLGKRYQHVRNVLEADKVTARAARGVSGARTVNDLPGRFRLEVGKDGTLILTDDAMAALGVAPGGVLIGLMRGDEMVLVEGRKSSKRAQARVAHLIVPGVSVVDELIADRRREAARDCDD